MNGGVISNNQLLTSFGGGGVRVSHEFTMTGGTITGNDAGSGPGGGVYLQGFSGGTVAPIFNMSGGTISYNTAYQGGGVFQTGAYATGMASVNITGGTFIGNASLQSGGGYVAEQTIGTIDNATFAGNQSAAEGAAIWGPNPSALVTVSNTIFENNVALTGNQSAITQYIDVDNSCITNNGIGWSGDVSLSADGNWWGDATGPAPGGIGDTAIGNVGGFSAIPILGCPDPNGAVKPDNYVVAPGATLTVPATAGVLANDTGVSSASLNYGPVPSNAGTLNFNADGSFTFVSNGSYVGFVRFQYVAGGQSGNVEITVGNDVQIQYPDSILQALSGETVAIEGIQLVNAGDPVVDITLTVLNGVLAVDTLGGDLGVNITGNGTNVLTLQGTMSLVNQLLAPVYYTPNAGATSDQLSISSTTGFGFSQAPPLTIEIQILNPALVVGAPDTPLPIPGVSVFAPPGQGDQIVTMSLSVSFGTLNVNDTVVRVPTPHGEYLLMSFNPHALQGVIVTGIDTDSITITGMISDVNAVLETLVYTPNPRFIGTDELVIVLTDASGTQLDSEITLIQIGDVTANVITVTETTTNVVVTAPQVPVTLAQISLLPDTILYGSVPAGAVPNGDVFVQILAQNGTLSVDPAQLGDPALINQDVNNAAEIFGMTNTGSRCRNSMAMYRCVCRAAGTFTSVTQPEQPRVTLQMNTTNEGNYTCAMIPIRARFCSR